MGKGRRFWKGRAANHHEKAGINRKPSAGAEGEMHALGKEQIEEADGRRCDADHKQRQHPAMIRNPARHQQPKAQRGQRSAQPALWPARGEGVFTAPGRRR